MSKRSWMYGVVVAAIALSGAIANGCGSSTAETATGDAGLDGSQQQEGGPTLGCGAFGLSCSAGADCCSNVCDPTTHKCASTLTSCNAAGAGCSAATECCSLTCSNGKCGATTCISDNQACSSNASCCGGTCAAAGTCKPLNTTCKTAGNTCAQSAECCSQLCTNGVCNLASSFCIQNGDLCARPGDCCGGVCTIASGASVGTCGSPPPGPSFCNGGMDGTVCADCNACCSRLCAPYALTGVKICQPANGCHIDGDLCRKSSDCCGGGDAGLPGDGNVVCVIQPGYDVGICRNPTGCNPEGNVCHFKNYACSISSARNDCCGAPGNSGACQLDGLGVPRCHAITACRPSGETCSNTADCCNGVPCIPDPQGVLRCAQASPDGGVACSNVSGGCTVNADCCSGLTCFIGPGGTNGTCGTVRPPPPVDGGTDSGVGVTDAGTLTCSQYGQSCTQASDCCNGIPCSATNGAACNPAGGVSPCTCVIVIR